MYIVKGMLKSNFNIENFFKPVYNFILRLSFYSFFIVILYSLLILSDILYVINNCSYQIIKSLYLIEN